MSVITESIDLRPMQFQDISAATVLGNRCTPESWREQQYTDCLKDGYSAWCLYRADQLIGVGIVMSAVDDMELLNVFIDPDFQGRGYGRYLVQFLLQEGARVGKRHCYLEVRQSNQVAQALYTSLGFEPIGRRKGYYPSLLTLTNAVREDAIVMACVIKPLC